MQAGGVTTCQLCASVPMYSSCCVPVCVPRLHRLAHSHRAHHDQRVPPLGQLPVQPPQLRLSIRAQPEVRRAAGQAGMAVA